MDIKIYNWDDAQDFKYNGSHGGDEDYVVTVLKGKYEESFAVQDRVHHIVNALTVCKNKVFECVIDGALYKVWVTTHA